jgi:hypothetical protein
MIPPFTGCCWYSLRMDGCVVFWPSSVTSRIACKPCPPVSTRRSSRSGMEIAYGLFPRP